MYQFFALAPSDTLCTLLTVFISSSSYQGFPPSVFNHDKDCVHFFFLNRSISEATNLYHLHTCRRHFTDGTNLVQHIALQGLKPANKTKYSSKPETPQSYTYTKQVTHHTLPLTVIGQPEKRVGFKYKQPRQILGYCFGIFGQNVWPGA